MTSLNDTIEMSARWLARQQDDVTGGWCDRSGGRVNVLNTAEAIVALLDADSSAAVTIPNINKRIGDGVKYLLQRQCQEGGNRGAWVRDLADGQSGADIARTSVAVIALIEARQELNGPAVQPALEWLTSLQRDDGGFGFRRASSKSELLPTCFVLSALLAAYGANSKEAEVYKDQFERGMKYLESLQNDDGSFGNETYLQAAYTIRAALIYQGARRLGCSVVSGIEEGAISWLNRRIHEATKPVEDCIEVDVDGSPQSYVYVIMTDSLLVHLMAHAADSKNRKGAAAREAMIALNQRIDQRSGGCYGSLVFSWATAKVVSALHVAKDEYTEMPRREPQVQTASTVSGHLLFGLTVFLVIAIIVILLAVPDVPGWVPVLLAFLTLIPLLGYRFIGEQTFKSLASGLTSWWTKKPEAGGDEG